MLGQLGLRVNLIAYPVVSVKKVVCPSVPTMLETHFLHSARCHCWALAASGCLSVPKTVLESGKEAILHLEC